MLDRSSSQQGSCKKKLPGLGFKLDFKNSGESQSVCVIQIKSMSLDAERNFAVNRTNQIWTFQWNLWVERANKKNKKHLKHEAIKKEAKTE